MIKRFLLPLSLCLLLCGCSNKETKVIVSDIPVEKNTGNEQIYNTYKWGIDDYAKLKATLSKCTYVTFIQETKIHNNEGFENYINYNVTVDIKTKEASIIKCSGDNICDAFKQEEYKYNWGTDEFLKKDFNKWVSCKLESEEFLEKFKKSENVYFLLSEVIDLPKLNANLDSKLQDNSYCEVVLTENDLNSSFTTYIIDTSSNMPIYCSKEGDTFSTYISIQTIK